MKTEPHDIKTFEDLSEKYSTWIIKYCSKNFKNPLFLVWYTDTDKNSTDRLLTYKSGEIFATNSLTTLKTTISSLLNNLNKFETINSWLDNLDNFNISEYCTYDLISIEQEIEKNNLDIETLEGFTNFVNLFSDFVNQDKRNKKLQVYADNELIKKTWEYFIDFIFWPRLNDKEKFGAQDRPPLIIDTKELLVKLKDITEIFDANIKKIEENSS